MAERTKSNVTYRRIDHDRLYMFNILVLNRCEVIGGHSNLGRKGLYGTEVTSPVDSAIPMLKEQSANILSFSYH
jgi:hypothetical protein